ncbi:MAG: hypothetical protein HZA46_09140 [Planctomycetales bacterium]|nr:hypothetical protein [Planctomycetales bacterium]
MTQFSSSTSTCGRGRFGGRMDSGYRWFLTIVALVVGIANFQSAPPVHAQAKRKVARDLPAFVKQHTDLHRKFAKALEDIAVECDEKNLTEAAANVRLLAAPVDTSRLRVTPLPREVQPDLPADLPPDERFWRAQTRQQRKDYSQKLYQLSRRALDSGHVSFAFDLVRETAFHEPDHPTARKILGFVRSGTEWMSPFEAVKLKSGQVWHDRFGWLPKSQVERYEKGERFVRGRWMSEAKADIFHEDFRNAWEIRTEHFRIKTNHSLDRGVELATKLEIFHTVFFQTFASFFHTPEAMKNLFSGSDGAARVVAAPYEVYFYRTKDEYLAELRPKTTQPIEITNGMFFPQTGISYFFDDPKATEAELDATLYHEATHQLFSVARPRAVPIGQKSDFWIIEGIACYMESFVSDPANHQVSLGDPYYSRFVAARLHLENDKYYVPLQEFTRMGMAPYQSVKQPQIAWNYSQGAALTHFFMHFDGARYRDDLIEHLSQIYSDTKRTRDAPAGLDELTGVPFDELDQQYQAYLKNLNSKPLAMKADRQPPE